MRLNSVNGCKEFGVDFSQVTGADDGNVFFVQGRSFYGRLSKKMSAVGFYQLHCFYVILCTEDTFCSFISI